ncbi:hypothetical protein [Stenoxybacter acetivorans]|nr:hypothetical protein [Stenoxybacter acetivorans]
MAEAMIAVLVYENKAGNEAFGRRISINGFEKIIGIDAVDYLKISF